MQSILIYFQENFPTCILVRLHRTIPNSSCLNPPFKVLTYLPFFYFSSNSKYTNYMLASNSTSVLSQPGVYFVSIISSPSPMDI